MKSIMIIMIIISLIMMGKILYNMYCGKFYYIGIIGISLLTRLQVQCVRTRVRTSSDSEVMNLSRSVSIVQKIACPSPLMSEIVSVSVHICTESYWFLVYQLLVTPKFNFRKELHQGRSTSLRQPRFSFLRSRNFKPLHFCHMTFPIKEP